MMINIKSSTCEEEEFKRLLPVSLKILNLKNSECLFNNCLLVDHLMTIKFVLLSGHRNLENIQQNPGT